MTAYAPKSAELAARIAGVLTLWENLLAQELSAEAMAAGIELAQFYLSEASRHGRGDDLVVGARMPKSFRSPIVIIDRASLHHPLALLRLS